MILNPNECSGIGDAQRNGDEPAEQGEPSRNSMQRLA
jgi:hypothetical protein